VIIHICKKSTRRRYLVTFIVLDLLFVGVAIAMISVYAFAGVPNNCGGMTRQNCKSTFPSLVKAPINLNR
jgi:hypothetical protein